MLRWRLSSKQSMELVSTKPMFTIGDIAAFALGEADIPHLQRFFERNPEYFITVGGDLPQHDTAKNEFFDRPPAEMPYDKVYVLGFLDAAGDLVAMTSLVENLFAKHVWHVGLFVVATSLHGAGIAHAFYAALEEWLQKQGALWIRLGVVKGNVKAEGFWRRQQFVEVRCRHDVLIGKLTHTISVMIKPVSDRDLNEYLKVVSRDQPDSS